MAGHAVEFDLDSGDSQEWSHILRRLYSAYLELMRSLVVQSFLRLEAPGNTTTYRVL